MKGSLESQRFLKQAKKKMGLKVISSFMVQYTSFILCKTRFNFLVIFDNIIKDIR